MLASISPRQKVAVMVAVLTAMLLSALDQTIVSTAMPRIVQDLNGLEHLSWVFTAYMLASTVSVPIYGKLSDMYGRKGFLISAVLIFLVGSMLSGQSHSMTQLIVFRALQGIGGGAIMANAFAVIGDLFTPAERGRWQGLMGGVFGLASVIGPALGGWLTDHASWRWTFYVNLPVGILALVLLSFLMPKISSGSHDRKIDYAGAALLAGGLVSLLLGFVWGGAQYPWHSWQVEGVFALSAALLALFGVAERYAKEPILPLSLFRSPVFSVSMLIIFLSGVTMFGSILYIPLFAQGVLGISATNSGTILTPLMMGMVGMSVVSGQIVSRTGKYKWLAILGMAVVTLALYLLSHMSPETTRSALVWRMILAGVGLGTTFPVFNVAVQNAFDRSQLGVVTASTQLFRSIGGTVGVAIMGSVMNTTLADKVSSIAGNPFIQQLQKANAHFATLDANAVQALLSAQVQSAVQGSLSVLPPAVRAEQLAAFNGLISQVKDIYAASIAHVFLAASELTLVAFVAAFFLKEIPLQGFRKPSAQAEGVEISEELGVFPEDQPSGLTPGH